MIRPESFHLFVMPLYILELFAEFPQYADSKWLPFLVSVFILEELPRRLPSLFGESFSDFA
jgi:hypothetical protein